MPNRLTYLLAALMVPVPALAQMTPLPSPPQPPAGFYTLDQATAGAQVYQKSCSKCHGEQMEGYIGPSLRGHAFQIITSKQTSADRLLLIISRNEPQNNPGSLSDDDDANVLAYILQINGYPSGKTKLAGFNARGLTLTGR